MLSAEIMKQIRHIHLRTNRMANDLLQGSYHSAFKGHGMEFDQVREYQIGEDIRLIDWNVTARMDVPYIKQYIEEREITVMLVVDISASGGFGSVHQLKKEVAAEFAAVIAYSAIKNKDKIGLIMFSDQVELYIPPRKGRNHVWKVIREILTYQPRHRGTDINAGLDYLNKMIKRKAVTFLISDFLADNFEKTLRLSNQRHDLIAVPIVDPRERELPPVGLMEIRDLETGQVLSVDTLNRKIRDRFKEKRLDYEAQLRTVFRRAGVDELWVQAGQSYLIALIRLFQKRGQRR
ncbi:MAG: DUF58 domain-containing protein [SAR324 cluster bacterium]|nr:DUF58 domain-containing protein [SAR324 cluster bacterium]